MISHSPWNSLVGKLLLVFVLALPGSVCGQSRDLALTPPMGWNSWNAFEMDITSAKVRAVADSMVSKGLAAAGYQYVIIDDGWQIDRDAHGRIIVDSTRFPEGIKYLADYVHAKGLKFGIYTCCGTKTCGGKPGSYGYEAIDAKTYAEWGVDYIKEDWCNTEGMETRTQYAIMSKAIKATGRPMVLSLCEWGISSPWEWGKGIGQLWRTTSDIQDCFDCVRVWGGLGWSKILDQNADLAPFAGPGHWNDPDMLEIGNKALTVVECRSHFSLWCMMAAPLIAGNNIATMSNTIRDILVAPELIAIDQDPLGIQGTRIRDEGGLQIWQKPLADGSIAVALLNLTRSVAVQTVSLEELGLQQGVACSVRDVWERTDLAAITDTVRAQVEPHGVVVLKLKGKKAPPSVLKFSQTALTMGKGNHMVIEPAVLPLATPVTVSSSNGAVASVMVVGVNKYLVAAHKVGRCKLVATTADGLLQTSFDVQVTPSAVPVPWKVDAINDPRASVEYQDGVYTMAAGGFDIWGPRDEFAYVNQMVAQDYSIVARVVAQSNSDQWAKSGLMMRETLSPESRFVMVCVTPVHGVSLQWRDTSKNICGKKDFDPVPLPVYLKLTRRGSTFTAYKSADGVEWTLLGDVTLKAPFSTKYHLGMEVVSHSAHVQNISTFDKLSIQRNKAKER